MSIQFIAFLTIRHNSAEAFEKNISWLSKQISSNKGWELVVCSWQSPNPSPNDIKVVHVWDTPYNTAIDAREAFNQILAKLDSQRVEKTMSSIASKYYLFTRKKVYE